MLQIAYPRRGGAGHDLEQLASLVPVDHPLRIAALEVADLTPWATAFRYPFEDAVTGSDLPSIDDLSRRLSQVDDLLRAVTAALR